MGKDTQLIWGRAEVLRHEYLPFNFGPSLMTTLRPLNLIKPVEITAEKPTRSLHGEKINSGQTADPYQVKHQSKGVPKQTMKSTCVLDNLLL